MENFKKMRAGAIAVITLFQLIFSVCIGNLYAAVNNENLDSTDENTDNGYKTPEEYITGMTDDEIQHCSDSIREALFPPVEIVTYDGSPINFPTDDESQVPIWIDNPHVPKEISVDTSKEVGSVDIISGYTQTGAKTYEIPINLFPGINGFTPQISLCYNSQRGNSVYGYGWSLSGVSAISRASNDVYHDGTPKEMNYDNNDAFVLDGVRLIKLSTESDHIIYQTETGNIKVKAHCDSNNIGFFEVFYPDGRHANYGWSSNQKNTLQYPLTTIADIYGNKITYTYTVSDSHYYIYRIDYNGAYISFKYKDRTDPILAYRCGIKLQEPKLLEEISCFLENSLWSRYTLGYTVQNNASLLSTVTYSSAVKSMNPIRFYYGEGSKGNVYKREQIQLASWFNTTKPDQLKIIRGEFSKNKSHEGIVSFPIGDPYYYIVNNSGVQYYKNIYPEDQSILIYPILDTQLVTANKITMDKGFVDIVCGDIDGEGRDKIIKINNNIVNDKDVVTFTVYKYLDTYGSIAKDYTREYSLNAIHTDKKNNKSLYPKYFYTGDFNGDGRIDIMAVFANTPFGTGSETTTCYIFNLFENQIIYKGKPFKYNKLPNGVPNTEQKELYNLSDKLLVFDYNGDGKTDVCHINNDKLTCYTFDNTSWLKERAIFTDTSIKNSVLRDQYLYIGDFNGDGLIDILNTPDKTTKWTSWTQYNSKGKNGMDLSKYDIASAEYSSTDGFIIQDVNNDGISDFIKYTPSGFTTFLSDGEKACINIGIETAFNGSNSILIPLNITTSGKNTRLIGLKDGKVTKYILSRNDSRDRMITGMANSLGIIECNYYHTLNDSYFEHTVHQKGYGAVFPYINIEEPIQVVAKTETYHKGNKINSRKYEYYNAVANRHGLGFCGFQKILLTDIHGRTLEETYDPYNFRVKKGEKSATSESQFNYSYNVSKNKIAQILLSDRLDIDRLRNDSIKSRYYYDDNGSLSNEYISYPSGLDVAKYYSRKNNMTIGTGYYIGLLDNTTITKTKDDITLKEKVYVESFDKIKPTSVITKVNDWNVRKQTYSYDTHGNTVSEAFSNYSSDVSHSKSYSYDKYGRLIKKIDVLGLSEEYEYNNNGVLMTTIDTRGNSSSFSYDSFRRSLKSQYPDGRSSEVKRGWGYSDIGGLYYITESFSDSPSLTRVYNALDQEIRQITMRFDGNRICTDKRYDDYGRLSKVSLPFKEGENPLLWDTYEYDAIDRPLKIKEASGKTTSYSYSGKSISTTIDNVTTTKVYDELGNVIESSDPVSSVKYTLRPDGKPLEVVAHGSVSTKYEYDNFDRLVKYTDPSLGGCYEYDATGSSYKEKLYLGGGYYDSPLVYVKTPGKGEHYHIVRDYHGSITEIINSTGSIVERLRYNAWGQRIDFSTSQPYEYGKEPELFLGRGYTGHEHIPQFGLINMNARLYDPVLGRFLSPDPYIQDENNPQNWNRYTYALNNPLKYIDRDGEFWWIVAGAAVGGVFNLIDKAMSGQIHSFGDGLLAFGVGAVGGAIGTFAGGLGYGFAAAALGTTGGFVAGAAAGFASSFASIPTLSLGNHLAFGDPMVSAEEYALGIALGSFTGGMNGGLSSKFISNENFWVGSYVPKTNLYLSLNTGGSVGVDISDVDLRCFASKANKIKGYGKYGNTVGGKSKPLQNHHFATDKNKTYTPLFEKIVSKFGLKLNADWNIRSLPHQGRHPNMYHKWVLREMRKIENIPNIDQEAFKIQFEIRIINKVMDNPEILYKQYWKLKYIL